MPLPNETPSLSLLYEGVDHHAVTRPENIAFRCRDQSLTYSALSKQSNQLANTLIDIGIKKGARIGIYCQQSLKVPVSVFGIQKAAAAFVPIDPSVPKSRLQQIIDEFDIEILITEDNKAGLITQITKENHTLKKVISCQKEAFSNLNVVTWQDIDQASELVPSLVVSENDLAYIMTTSGSTATPKGIMHTHFSGTSYAKLSASTYAVNSRDCIGSFVPLHFDISTFGYFTGPLVGATTVLIPEETMLFPANLVDVVEKLAISIWYSAPYPLVKIAQNKLFENRKLDLLRWIKFGGEAMHAKYLVNLMAHLPNTRFANVYGPAEVNQCTHQTFETPPNLEEALPIGKVWAQTSALVLDANDKEVTDSTQGELLIHSPTMMQGYWNRPDLNERAFYLHTTQDGQTVKYYRTGDLVIINGEGEMTFVGRKDRQVKVRGYRVELEEIEAHLALHDKVQEAVAAIDEDQSKNAHIVAAVTLADAGGMDVKVLQQYAKKRLPSYAVPTRIKVLESFPRTSGGKVNRLAVSNLLVTK